MKTIANNALTVIDPHAQGAENSTAPTRLLVAKSTFRNAGRDAYQCTPPINHGVGIVVVNGQAGVISAESTQRV